MKFKALFFATLAFVFIGNQAEAQSFKRGILLLGISGGSTTANITTNNYNPGENSNTRFSKKIDGIRDPFIIELGISKRWGIGVSSGTDFFEVNSKDFYGFKKADGKTLEIGTSEFTFDLNYHLYSGRRIDWSVFASAGSFGVNFDEKNGESSVKYQAKGGIFRYGTKVRYYFWKRLGFLAILSNYKACAKPVNTSEGLKYSTSLKGNAIEYGLCFKIF